MSLSDYLERRRVETNSSEATPPTAVPADAKPQSSETPHAAEKQGGGGLLLRFWNRVIWTLSWTHFMDAQFEPSVASGADSIRLVFAKREIVLLGRNLAGLMEPIARQLLGEVREMPEGHMTPANAESGAPVVWEIRLCERERERAK